MVYREVDGIHNYGGKGSEREEGMLVQIKMVVGQGWEWRDDK